MSEKKQIVLLNPTTSVDELFIPGDTTFVKKGFRGLNVFGKVRFFGIIITAYVKLFLFHSRALLLKRAAIGPFWGEFGNFHLHYYPYVAYLHSKGVKLDLCVIDNYLPFLVDEAGDPLYENVVKLENILGIIKSSGNELKEVGETQKKMYQQFIGIARKRKKPLLDLSDKNLYWYVYRNWQLNGRQYIYRRKKTFTKRNDHKPVVALFPRNISGAYSPQNGYAWDYMELARGISPQCERILITGHPSMSSLCAEEDNIKLRLSPDNTEILRVIDECDLIITQHSGAMHIANYYQKPVCIIFKGVLPVKGMDD